jgi:hypothetical protein
MREFLEVRVDAEHFEELFSVEEGRLGEAVFVVRLETSDRRFPDLAKLQAKHRAKGASFFYGWEYIRKYTQSELENAQLFQFSIAKHMEPTGEECGTVYDDSGACPHCGVGRRQQSVLRLDLTRLPKASAFAQTIARDERVAMATIVRGLAEAERCCSAPRRPRRHSRRWSSGAG